MSEQGIRSNGPGLLALGLAVLLLDLPIFAIHPEVSGATLMVMVVGIVIALFLIAIAIYRVVKGRSKTGSS